MNWMQVFFSGRFFKTGWVLAHLFFASALAGQRVDFFEIGAGTCFYLPKYQFISENGNKEGLSLPSSENQIGPAVEVLAVKKLRRRLNFSAGFRYWAVPTNGRFYIDQFVLTQGFLPETWHFLSIPTEVRFRASSFFSLEAGWQQGWMLNFSKISELFRPFFNSADFAATVGCRYHFGRLHVGLRYCQNFGAFSQIYSGASPVTKSELRHRQFQVLLGYRFFEKK